LLFIICIILVVVFVFVVVVVVIVVILFTTVWQIKFFICAYLIIRRTFTSPHFHIQEV